MVEIPIAILLLPEVGVDMRTHEHRLLLMRGGVREAGVAVEADEEMMISDVVVVVATQGLDTIVKMRRLKILKDD